MRLLLIEDESRIVEFLRRCFEADGFCVQVAADGRDGLRQALQPDVDLVVLDLLLPGLDGEDVLARVRGQRPDVPVIVLTAKDAVADRVANLRAGADDYVTKPFSYLELLARVEARLRGRRPEPAVLQAGGLTLDLRRRNATRGELTTRLTAREFSLLELLLRHPRATFSQTALMWRAWGFEAGTGSNQAEVYVGYLRRKLGVDVIETVRGEGYRLGRTP